MDPKRLFAGPSPKQCLVYLPIGKAVSNTMGMLEGQTLGDLKWLNHSNVFSLAESQTKDLRTGWSGPKLWFIRNIPRSCRAQRAASTNFRETQGLEVKRSKSPGCSDTCSLHNSGDSLLGLDPTYMSSSNTVLPGRRYRAVVALFSDWQAIWDWQIHFTFRTLRRNYAWRRKKGWGGSTKVINPRNLVLILRIDPFQKNDQQNLPNSVSVGRDGTWEKSAFEDGDLFSRVGLT